MDIIKGLFVHKSRRSIHNMHIKKQYLSKNRLIDLRHIYEKNRNLPSTHPLYTTFNNLFNSAVKKTNFEINVIYDCIIYRDGRIVEPSPRWFKEFKPTLAKYMLITDPNTCTTIYLTKKQQLCLNMLMGSE